MKTIIFTTIVLGVIPVPAVAAGFPEKKWDQVNPNGNSTGSATSYSLSAGSDHGGACRANFLAEPLGGSYNWEKAQDFT